MSTERQQLEATIAGLEAQRALLGNAVVNAALAPLRAKLVSLAAAPTDEPPAQSLKQVTILFADIVGSTTLSQHLDPEATGMVMERALAQFAAIVEQHGGKVLKYAGDSVLAVFGAVEAREDDPERAVRAGLAILEGGREEGEQVRREHGYDGFTVRVGVHTGGVLLGGGVDAKESIHGQAVNIAARMEQTAPPGGLRISHDTYRHVRGVFSVEPQPLLAVKGVDEPIATHIVLNAKPRAFRMATRGIEGVETRMIGRDAELEQLQNAFQRLCSGGTLAAVTVVGEAGMGKSRLLYEFQNWAEARPEGFYFFQGRAHPQTQGQAYGLLRDILTWRLQIADSESMEAAKQKVEQGIASYFAPDDGDDTAQAHAHLLGHLIGLDFSGSRHIKGILNDGKQIRNRGFHAGAQMFRRIPARDSAPIVLLLEDLHWADDGSLDFLNYLAQVNRDVPMLMLGVTRPTFFERRNYGPFVDAQRIELGPLDKSSSRELANELLKKLPQIPAALRALITGGAEGNPFFMEELVKMLVDEGAIETGPERWTLHSEKLLATHVPQTLTGVLQARLDGLAPAEKLALQQASVIGLVFWDQALSSIDPKATDALPSLLRRELVVRRQDASLEGVREYAFKHQILHQVTYDTLLKRTRRDLHAQVAYWLAGRINAHAGDLLGATAEHFEKGGEATKACEFFTRAAEHAANRFAHGAAMRYIAHALVLLGKEATAGQTDQPDKLVLRWRLLDVRERSFDLQGKRTEQCADIAALQCIADALDDDRRRSEVAWRRSDIAMRTGEFRAMEGAAREAMSLAERAGDRVMKLRAQQHLASALGLLGDVAAGKALAQDGLAASRSLGSRPTETLFLNTLAFIANQEDDLVLTLKLCQQILPLDRELGDPRGEAISLLNVGISWLDLGEPLQARHHLEESLRLTRAVGDRLLESNTLNNLSRLALLQGDDALALVHAQSALDISVAAADPSTTLSALCHVGDAELALGRHQAAAAAFERARTIALGMDNPHPFRASAGLARVALAEGDV
ncbi:MAG: adenylate/guanylate cyclase domain-containing protein, partial [Burkholderiales bacterium]